jgi:hypothetical protein
MASEMIERVARALAIADGRDPEGHSIELRDGSLHLGKQWEAFVPTARAAIEAMQEPMPEMMAAISLQTSTDGCVNYRAMLNAARAEPAK